MAASINSVVKVWARGFAESIDPTKKQTVPKQNQLDLFWNEPGQEPGQSGKIQPASQIEIWGIFSGQLEPSPGGSISKFERVSLFL